MPIDSGNPVFWNVTSMPDAAPRLRPGTLFITDAVFGAANSPNAAPFRNRMAANAG